MQPDEPSRSVDAAARLYARMRATDLARLRHAFVLDRDAPDASDQSRAFANGRLAAIDAEFRRRETAPRKEPRP